MPPAYHPLHLLRKKRRATKRGELSDGRENKLARRTAGCTHLNFFISLARLIIMQAGADVLSDQLIRVAAVFAFSADKSDRSGRHKQNCDWYPGIRILHSDLPPHKDFRVDLNEDVAVNG